MKIYVFVSKNGKVIKAFDGDKNDGLFSSILEVYRNDGHTIEEVDIKTYYTALQNPTFMQSI